MEISYSNELYKLREDNKLLVQALKNCVITMERARHILQGKDGGNWGMLDTKEAKEAIKKSENEN